MRLSLVPVPMLGVLALLHAGMTPVVTLANGISVTVNATVAEIQCTPAQRLRIRACAPAVESTTLEAAKVLVPRTPLQDARAGSTSYDVRQDPQRKVLVRTLYF